jgi:hypothetical protein
MPNTITEEWIQHRATKTLTVMTAPLKDELTQANATIWETDKMAIKTMARNYKTKNPNVKVVSDTEQSKTKISPILKFTAVVVVLLLGMYVFSTYVPPPSQTQGIAPTGYTEIVTPQSEAPKFVSQGGIVKSCDQAQICIVQVPNQVRR